MLTVADMGKGVSKISKKVLMYFMDGPICIGENKHKILTLKTN